MPVWKDSAATFANPRCSTCPNASTMRPAADEDVRDPFGCGSAALRPQSLCGDHSFITFPARYGLLPVITANYSLHHSGNPGGGLSFAVGRLCVKGSRTSVPVWKDSAATFAHPTCSTCPNASTIRPAVDEDVRDPFDCGSAALLSIVSLRLDCSHLIAMGSLEPDRNGA